MSDPWLIYIPEDPHAAPTQPAIETAVALLRAIAPEAEDVRATLTQNVRFHDCGENWSGVACPGCAADVETWWITAMEPAHEAGFETLGVVMPCCDATTTLNDLTYLWPVGFARFDLHARNPNIDDTTPDVDATIAVAIGFSVRKIWRRI